MQFSKEFRCLTGIYWSIQKKRISFQFTTDWGLEHWTFQKPHKKNLIMAKCFKKPITKTTTSSTAIIMSKTTHILRNFVVSNANQTKNNNNNEGETQTRHAHYSLAAKGVLEISTYFQWNLINVKNVLNWIWKKEKQNMPRYDGHIWNEIRPFKKMVTTREGKERRRRRWFTKVL